MRIRVIPFWLLVSAVGLAACSEVATSPSADQPNLAVGRDGNRQYVIVATDTTAVPGELAEAVGAAGGTLTRVMPDIGVAVATSADPRFAAKAAAIEGVESVAADKMVQWIDPYPFEAVAEETIGEETIGEQTIGEETIGEETVAEETTVAVVASAEVPIASAAVAVGGDETFFPVQWAPRAISAPQAWDAGAFGEGVRVAILDGGIHKTHVDLVKNLEVTTSASFARRGEPDDRCGGDIIPFDSDLGTVWHGTHVAGIVGAADNALGTIGIAPKATLIGVKVLHGGGGCLSWLIEAIQYAAKPVPDGAGADVINISLGALADRKNRDDRELMKALDRATKFAHKRGVTIIAAAGNEGVDLDKGDLVAVPAESKHVIAISATAPIDFAHGATFFDNLASYTNFGRTAITFAAPGGDGRTFIDFKAPTPNPNRNCAYRDAKGVTRSQFCYALDFVVSPCRGQPASNSTYCWSAGTSMAAPATAGVAALIIGWFGRIGPDEVEAVMRFTSDDLGPPGRDPCYGRGRVNAFRAIGGGLTFDVADDLARSRADPRCETGSGAHL
jgi:subtilisin family serine protease